MAALIAATAALLSGERVLYGDPTGAVPLEMPETLGPWTAETLVFCQSDQCGASFPKSKLEDGATNCPICGAALGAVSVGETKLLPANTPIFRRLYHRAGHPDIVATFVFSGMERRSIHKPQRCLVAQGNQIVDEYTHRARCAPDREMNVRALEMTRPVRSASGEVTGAEDCVYTYWLFNPERETVHHMARLLRMLFDNAFRSYRPRWGYASISVPRQPEKPDAWKEELDDFLPRLYPTIVKLRADMNANRDKSLRLTGGSWEANAYDGENAVLNTSSPPAPPPSSADAPAPAPPPAPAP